MLSIEEIKAKTETAREEGFGLQQFDDLDLLVAEVEGLNEQHRCDVHNIAAMRSTLDQQAKNCEELIESYKKSNLEQATENYELEQENIKLKSDVERLTAEVKCLDNEYHHYRRISEDADQQIATLKKALEVAIDRALPNSSYSAKQAITRNLLEECTQQLTHETHGKSESKK